MNIFKSKTILIEIIHLHYNETLLTTISNFTNIAFFIPMLTCSFEGF